MSEHLWLPEPRGEKAMGTGLAIRRIIYVKLFFSGALDDNEHLTFVECFPMSSALSFTIWMSCILRKWGYGRIGMLWKRSSTWWSVLTLLCCPEKSWGGTCDHTSPYLACNTSVHLLSQRQANVEKKKCQWYFVPLWGTRSVNKRNRITRSLWLWNREQDNRKREVRMRIVRKTPGENRRVYLEMKDCVAGK